MTCEEYTAKIQELYVNRHLLVIEMSRNGPTTTYTVRYNPLENATEHMDYDFITAIADIDKQILEVTSKVKTELWFADYENSLLAQKFKLNKLPPFEF